MTSYTPAQCAVLGALGHELVQAGYQPVGDGSITDGVCSYADFEHAAMHSKVRVVVQLSLCESVDDPATFARDYVQRLVFQEMGECPSSKIN